VSSTLPPEKKIGRTKKKEKEKDVVGLRRVGIWGKEEGGKKEREKSPTTIIRYLPFSTANNNTQLRAQDTEGVTLPVRVLYYACLCRCLLSIFSPFPFPSVRRAQKNLKRQGKKKKKVKRLGGTQTSLTISNKTVTTFFNYEFQSFYSARLLGIFLL
jgi:hypothetical protein